MKKNTKKTNARTPIVIAAIATGATALGVGLAKAFKSMKENAIAQHEVDKAEFAAVKAESKAFFEENRGRKTFARAKAQGKQSWDDAHMTPSERSAKEQEERDARIAAAEERIEKAKERYEEARK
jgi:hypothetical protein